MVTRRAFVLLALVVPSGLGALAVGCRQIAGLKDTHDCVASCVGPSTRLTCDAHGNAKVESCQTDANLCEQGRCVQCRAVGDCGDYLGAACSNEGKCEFQAGAPCGPGGTGSANAPHVCLGPKTRLSSLNRHTCALTEDGAVWCWGDGGHGELGDGTTVAKTTPVQVPGLPAIKAISAGYAHTCAVDVNGDIWCWGDNEGLQLGRGGEIYGPPMLTPGRVVAPSSTPPGGAHFGKFSVVAAGFSHTCALADDGFVWCWGANLNGQLGVGRANVRAAAREPMQLVFSEKVVLTSTPSAVIPTTNSIPISQLMAGKNHTCAITTGAKLYCWGGNDRGQVGIGTNTLDVTVPVPINVAGKDMPVLAAMATYATTCATTTSEQVFCWGTNEYGALGDGTKLNSYTSSVQVLTAQRFPLRNIHDLVTTSASVSCGFQTDDNGWTCWGSSWPGQLLFSPPDAGEQSNCEAGDAGDGRTPGNRLDAISERQHLSCTAEPTRLPGGSTILAIGDQHACMLLPDERYAIKCFGGAPWVGAGELTKPQLVPVAVKWPTTR